jgi:predicted Zn-dependent protease
MKSKTIVIIIFFCLISLNSCNTIESIIKGEDVTFNDVFSDTVGAFEITKEIKEVMRDDFTQQDRYYVGRSTSAYILGNYDIIENDKLTEYLNGVGSTVALASNMATTFNGYRFVAFDDDNPNAYATPGGMIFISVGMLKLCSNEDELAAVLAHEVQHIIEDHPMKAVNSQTRRKALITIAKSYLSKAADQVDINPEIFDNMVDIFGDMTLEVINVLDGYERKTEYEADKGAVMSLHIAGYSVNALINMISKLPYESGFKYSSIHPSPEDRIKELNRYIKELGIESHPINVDRAFRYTEILIEAGIIG